MNRVIVCAVVLVASVASADRSKPPRPQPAPPTVQGPPSEVTGDTVDVPAAPAFTLTTAASGHHTVKELRVAGAPLLGTVITVEGTITWVYDCLTAMRKPGQSKAQVQKLIDQDPTLCERKKFYLGDDKTTPPERALWVVDVPRPPNKMEKERLPRDEIKNWPAVPKYAVGDRVVLTGTFSFSSPHGERNSDGLLVYASLQRAPKGTAASTTIAAPVAPAIPAWRPPSGRAYPVDETTAEASRSLAAEGMRFYVNRKYDDAIAKFSAATKKWQGNHAAWYGFAITHVAKGSWAEASKGFDAALTLEPFQPMYLMLWAAARFEVATAAARAAGTELVGTDVQEMLGALQRAVKLEPRIWRAHYYTGRIYRALGYPVAATIALRASLSTGPKQSGPYIALAELYRRWDFPAEAREIVNLGTARITGDDSADLWYVLGMTYDDQRDAKLAVQAFTQALAARPNHPKALFQRGQAYVRLKDKAHAVADLEAFLKVGTAEPFALQQANKLLLDVAATR